MWYQFVDATIHCFHMKYHGNGNFPLERPDFFEAHINQKEQLCPF